MSSTQPNDGLPLLVRHAMEVLEAIGDTDNEVSSVLNKDVKQFGKQFLIDGKEDTSWNSDQDYFVDNHWSKVPKSWSHCLEDFELKDIPNLLSTDSESKFKCVLPLSLLSLRATCSALQLTRKWSPDSSIIFPKSHFSESTQQLDSELKDSNHPNMKTEILNRRVKHKKRHEIRRLSKLTDHLLKGMCDCKTIVDCGSGQGHLSRILSLCFGYDVISIEGNDDNVLGAQHKDMNTLNSLKRYKLTDRLNLDFPKKVNCLLQKDSSISEVTQNSDNHLLLGLHACGPLSTIILNQLKECNSAKALLLVSCCYMKIDSNSFPVSKLVKNLSMPYKCLSYEAKEVACHAIEKFVHKLQTNARYKRTVMPSMWRSGISGGRLYHITTMFGDTLCSHFSSHVSLHITPIVTVDHFLVLHTLVFNLFSQLLCHHFKYIHTDYKNHIQHSLEQRKLSDIIEYVKSLHINQIEFTCLKVLLLFRPECGGLSNGEHIRSMQDEAQILLYEQIQHTITSNTTPTSLTLRFGRLLLLLSALKRLNRTHFPPIHNSLLGLALNQLAL
ncbi:unnamed protein product [Oppiella nova]|uniref:NR LBD domain-containing protein n=1 Tax=Oppiella nova TaxID=334625 RepID=A0A7R9LJ89_9ACAR|nr:unnamed protein product [Oppiella nova]CAG2163778.1 unnamed protein product [Oppiella nova]